MGDKEANSSAVDMRQAPLLLHNHVAASLEDTEAITKTTPYKKRKDCSCVENRSSD